MTCSAPDCTTAVHARGLCQPHYNVARRVAGLKPKSAPTTPAANAEQTLRRGGALKPPRELPYRSVARSCPKCGDLMTTPPHLIRKDAGSLPKCGPCQVRAVGVSKGRRLARGDEAYRRRLMDHAAKNRARAQRESAETARRGGEEWTGPQLEVVAREDLSAREVAAILGRTLYAVRHMRRRVKTLPRDQWLAGKRTMLYQGAAR